ncbi:hemagglutinin repeat-containing protein [Fusobacterium animalis]|uniref:two-partner secretion domain-containing protein n=1 Tax=Fusobacterium animalis TaxID=76859 RepID=UPI0030D0A0C8
MADKKSLDFKRYFRNRIRRIEAFIMLILFSFNIFAEIVPDPASIGARATKTASGIDQLDITAPNKNGTSYNSLKELQVSEQGLILNNNKDIVVNTKTAGYVTRNRNLDNSIAASLIITEVTGKNKTNINGTVEVAGKRADLVMANRNGIYVNGGNFLNTDRVTLTTGSLEMKNGDLVAINVTQGQIGIGGKGIDALNLTDLELLGKTIDVSGVIKASKETRLLVSAGGQTYEYKTKEVKSKGESYKGIAIDGKAVGSMYAGKIDIISNDKGAGVNTKGDLVSVDDIVLTANGDITTAKVDSGKDLKYETTQKVKMNGKTTVAKKVKVKAKETEINAKVITGYLEKALGKKSLSIESEKTKITSKIEAYGKVEIKSDYTQNNGEISANEKINIVGNKLNNNNGEIRSQEKIAINTKETSNIKGYILSDGLTKEDVKKEENKNQKDVKDDKNKEKGIEITGDLDNREGIIRGKEVTVGGNLTGNNKGKIDSIGALTFNGKTIVNKGGIITGNIQELNVDKLINDEGKLLSTEKINGTAKETSNKNGEISGIQTVKLIGDKLNNLSGLIKSNGKIVLGMKETSNVKGYILSDGLTKEDVKKEENKNQKSVEEDKNKEKGIEITGDLDNREGVIRGREISLGNLTGNNKGKIDSIGALTFNGKTIVNKGGLISGNIQELNVDRLINDEGKLLSTEKISGTAKKISNVNGEVTGTQTVKLIGDKLNNLLGLIKSNGKITLGMKETSNVKGYILSDGLTKEDIKKEENKNQKDVKDDKNKEKGINITGDLDNREGVIRGKEVTVGGNLTGNNKGKIDSIGALTFNGKTIVNKGGLISGNIQELNVDKLINDEGKLVSTEKINGTAKEISNKNGEILGVKTVTLVGDRLNNLSGVIRSYGKIKLNEKDVSNVEGYILSDGITKEQAQNWKVEEKAIEESKDDKNQKDVNEKKEQTTGTLLNLGRLDNTKGIIASLSQTTVNIGKIANNDGKIVSKGAVELTTPNEYEYKGLVEGDYSTKLNAKKIIINDNVDRKNTLSLISKEELTLGQNIRARILSIATQADLRNTKDISATNLLSITAKNIENSGNLYSNGNTYLEAKNGDLINKDGGSIKADKQVYIKVENGRVVNGTERYLDGAYRREDGVFVDNRQISKEKPSIIAGKTETIIKAKDFINTSLIGKAGQGITYIELAGQGINASIGNNIAKIEGQKVSVEGNKGVTNIGAVISGTEITRVTSKNGKVLNESTITTEELTRTVEKKKKFLRKKYTEVYGTIERIRNIGKIEGNGIIYVEGKEIENVAGNIGGAGGTLLKSTLGNIEDKTITLVDNRKDVTETYTEMREVRPKGKWWRRREAENPEPKKYEQVQVYKYWDIVNKTKTVSGVIGNGKDTILDSAKDLVLESSDIRAKDNIALNAKNNLLMLSTVGTEYKFRTETSSKRSWGRKKTKTETWIEDNVYANPVELTSGGYILINYREKGKPADNKGVFAQGVNFNAKKGIIAKSDGNIYIQGVKDKFNSTYDSHTTKSFIGIKYKRTSDYVSDNREKYKHSQLYGESGVTLDSQGRLRVQGIDIQTIGPVYLKGVKGVEILSGNEISSRYELHTSKNFKIGSDKVLKIEQNKNAKEIDTIKSIGSIINSKGSMVTIEGDKVVSIGSKIGAAGDINLIGKNGVIIKDGENFAKIKEETEKMRTNLFASWSLKNLSASAGVEAVYNKTNDGKTMVTPEKNIFITNKNLNITSTSGNIFMQGDFGAKEDINVKAEKGKIYIKDSKSEVLTDSRNINARMALAFGINLSGIKDTLKSYRNSYKALKEIGNLGRVISFTRDMAKGKSLLESLDGKEDTINAMNTLFAGPSSGGVTAGLDLTGSVSAAKSTSKYLQNITTNIRAGKDIVFKSKEFETEGSFIRAENNLSIDASKILIQASADKYVINSKNMGANFGVTLMGVEGVSAGLNYGQMNSKGTLYNNAQIQAGNKLIVKADNMTIRGGRLEGKYVDVDVKENLLIESLQDSEKMKQIGTNVGYSLKYGKDKDGNPDNRNNGNLGLSYGEKKKLWVKEQSGIIGIESVKVKVGEKLSLIGSIIANIDDKGNDKGNLTLSYGKLEVKDLDSYDKQININGNVELNQRSKDNNKELVLKENKEKDENSKNPKNDKKNEKDSKDLIGEDVEERDNKVDETYGIGIEGSDKRKITRATIGKGVINGKEEVVGVNRDIGKSDEIIKDINVKKVEAQYKSERNSWGDLGKIMVSNAGVIEDFLDDFNEKALGKARPDYEIKFRNKVYESILRLERKLQTVADFTSLIPTEQYHGGLFEQIVRRKDQVKLIGIKIRMSEDGTPDIKLARKKKLSEIKPDDEGKVYIFGNGIRETEEGAVRNAILKSMSPENLERYKRGKTIEIALIYNPTRGFVADGLECVAGKLFDGSWSSLKITTNVSKQTAEILATRDRNTTYIDNMYSQGNEVGLGAFNWLQDKGIKLGYKDKNKFLVGMFGSPVMRDLIAGFGGPLNFTFRGSAINFRDFIGNDDKWFGVAGETTLINPENINRVKEHLWTDKLGNFFGTKAIFRRQTMGGLYLPEISNNKDKNKDEYRYSIVIGNEEKRIIKNNYSKVLEKDMEISDQGIEMVISDPHGTYTYESPERAEKINNLLKDYRKAITPEERAELENKIELLYKEDQQSKINLAMYGPPIFTDSPFLLKAVEDYKKEELKKEYGYGNYQDKGLPKNKEMNTSPQPYTRKEKPAMTDINEYLKSLRKGVGM